MLRLCVARPRLSFLEDQSALWFPPRPSLLPDQSPRPSPAVQPPRWLRLPPQFPSLPPDQSVRPCPAVQPPRSIRLLLSLLPDQSAQPRPAVQSLRLPRGSRCSHWTNRLADPLMVFSSSTLITASAPESFASSSLFASRVRPVAMIVPAPGIPGGQDCGDAGVGAHDEDVGAEVVRDVERRIQRAEAQKDRDIPALEGPGGVPVGLSDYYKIMVDFMVLAFQTDMTRVSTFQMGHEMSLRSYPESDLPTRPFADASSRRARQDRAGDSDQHPAYEDDVVLSGQAAEARRTATARCSITP